MLNKDQLIFDPTGADTTECDTVGSYILDGAGNTISSTDLGGGTQALDVNIAGGALNATVDLDFATDQVDASGSVVALDAATLAALEDITATVTGTVALDAATLAALEEITVTATDLDIRDLTAATDSVSISDGTDTLAVNADGSINVNFSPTGKQNVVETNNAIAASAAAVTTTRCYCTICSNGRWYSRFKNLRACVLIRSIDDRFRKS